MPQVWVDQETTKLLKEMGRNLERIADALERAYPDDLKLCSCEWFFPSDGRSYKAEDKHCPQHGRRAEALRAAEAELQRREAAEQGEGEP